jgi:hypothetical protein
MFKLMSKKSTPVLVVADDYKNLEIKGIIYDFILRIAKIFYLKQMKSLRKLILNYFTIQKMIWRFLIKRNLMIY